MKIKQVEECTGISAKNIRFYEQQGLLAPARNPDNRYREYDEGDVRTLKLIKMMRKLDMPLENIREVLAGQQPLAEVMQRHAEFLAQSIKDLESAQKICGQLAAQSPDVATLDVDGCLARIETEELQGGHFASIVNDFLAVAGAVEKMRFHFYPRELVTTPREFTDALLEYANEQKLDITITKESMYPQFLLDGVEYSAFRYTSRFGSVIAVEAKEPDGLLPRHVPRQRAWWMEWAWRTGLPICFIVGVLMLSGMGAGLIGVLTVVGIVVLLAAGIGGYYYPGMRLNKKSRKKDAKKDDL